jgi:hypothetical protein
MLKERIGRVLCLCLLAALFAAAAQLSALEPDDPLLGTWVNAQYEGNAASSAKFILFPDGRELDYDRLTSPEPEYEGWVTVDETWTDEEGNHWYKTHGSFDAYPYKEPKYNFFSLLKVDSSGTTLEGTGSEVDYPEEIGPIGGAYSTYRRQE